jgi:high-affinity Fe2+/Pb2+ permease
VSDVSDELDPLVMRLFGEDVARAPADGFEAVVAARIAQARRQHRIRYGLAVLACALIAALLVPYAVRGSVALAGSATDLLAALGQVLVSAGGWSVSLALTGIWLLRRSRVRRASNSWRPG